MTSALLVPQRAVTDLQGKSQIRTVGADNKVVVQTVTLGSRVGNRWIVQKGLSAGTRVIVDATAAQAGTVVKPQPAGPEQPIAEE
jgi:membrane fusion protein (multidrug efflux system)